MHDDQAAENLTAPFETANDGVTTAEHYSQNQDALQHANAFVKSIDEWKSMYVSTRWTGDHGRTLSTVRGWVSRTVSKQ